MRPCALLNSLMKLEMLAEKNKKEQDVGNGDA